MVGCLAVDDAQRRADGGGEHLDEAGLAARALAGDAIDFVLGDVERDVVDRAHLALHAEIVHQIVGLEPLDGQDISHRQAPMRRRRLRGSMYSLSDTAKRNRPTNIMMTMITGMRIHHHVPTTSAE